MVLVEGLLHEDGELHAEARDVRRVADRPETVGLQEPRGPGEAARRRRARGTTLPLPCVVRSVSRELKILYSLKKKTSIAFSIRKSCNICK